MIERLRQKIFGFINSPKDAPLLAGFSIGLYMVLYYYSKNFSLANSWQQFLFFIAYYMVLPAIILYAGNWLAGRFGQKKYGQQFLFIAIPIITAFFLLQLSYIGVSKRYFFLGAAVLAIALSFKLKQYYKLFILLLLFLSLFNLAPVLRIGYIAITSSDKWKTLPDDIAGAKFKKRPNIYYIQPDGYASFKNLKDSNHNFDNSDFESFLTQNGFTLYSDFRSNYFSTLLSNSSMFSMMHHYIEKDVDAYSARGIILGENPVIKVLKNNDYKTHFITEKPYLVINRPSLGYDFCNIDYGSLPFIKDGWDDNEDVVAVLKHQMDIQQSTGNFYFIEKMSPGHIHGLKIYSEGKDKERNMYIQSVKDANNWLTTILNLIQDKDPQAMIVIAADHGGFVGFDYTQQCLEHTDNPLLVNSIYGAACAIKWGGEGFKEYDGKLKTSVNLFRTIFSFLANDPKYLDNNQEDASYIRTSKPNGLYRYIDNNGNIVFDKVE